jgi:RNA polymerase sigma-70 factor, ECF subfamily
MAGEQELWDQLSRRDVEAFESFYRQHFSRIRSFVRAFVGSSQVAEDIAQETFFQLWKHPNGFNPSRSSLKNYIFGIAHRRAADWWRHNPPPRGPSTQRDAVVEESSRLLLADAIERLEPEVRGLLAA